MIDQLLYYSLMGMAQTELPVGGCIVPPVNEHCSFVTRRRQSRGSQSKQGTDDDVAVRSLRTIKSNHSGSLGFINLLYIVSASAFAIPNITGSRGATRVLSLSQSSCRVNRHQRRPNTKYQPHSPLLTPVWIALLPTMVHIHHSPPAPPDRLRRPDHPLIDIHRPPRVPLLRRFIDQRVRAHRSGHRQMQEDLVLRAGPCVPQDQG